jgi:D-alanyl-D-alanine carboxypeptidase (penicillin-binding protein 5/6)
MAKIAGYGMKMPAFRKIVGTEAKNIYYIRPAGHTAYCENINELLDYGFSELQQKQQSPAASKAA